MVNLRRLKPSLHLSLVALFILKTAWILSGICLLSNCHSIFYQLLVFISFHLRELRDANPWTTETAVGFSKSVPAFLVTAKFKNCCSAITNNHYFHTSMDVCCQPENCQSIFALPAGLSSQDSLCFSMSLALGHCFKLSASIFFLLTDCEFLKGRTYPFFIFLKNSWLLV
jgi:hypothetical protein